MADIVDSETRSRLMRGIKGKNTLPERLVRSALHGRGVRFRINRADLSGRPDLVLPRYHAVIFVHGCFWHWHGCSLFKLPRTNTVFWELKLGRNRERDKENLEGLRSDGWRTGVVWECAVRRIGAEAVAEQLLEWLRSPGREIEITADMSVEKHNS